MTIAAPSTTVVTARVDLPRPYDAGSLMAFFAQRTVAGLERLDELVYARTLRLPGGPAVLQVDIGDSSVSASCWLSDPADEAAAVQRCRALLDLDTDVTAAERHLASDPVLAASIRAHPGLRVPGHVDGFESAVRAVVGQQISVVGARTILGRLVDAYGDDLTLDHETVPDGLGRLFPTPESIVAVDPELLPMPRSRGRALVAVASAVASGRLVLDRGVPLEETRAALLALPGIGPWTADYIALRALGDHDVFLTSDLGIRHGLSRMGLEKLSPERLRSWSPWRSYALMHVWKSLDQEAG